MILPVGIFRIDSQTARLRPVFRRKPVFTRRRARIHGASGTKLPFRCNSLRRSTPTGPKGRKAPSGPFGPLGQPARFARRLDDQDHPDIDGPTSDKEALYHWLQKIISVKRRMGMVQKEEKLNMRRFSRLQCKRGGVLARVRRTAKD